MDFIKEINAFEQWLRTNYLPPVSQLLWYKLFMLCNGAGWPEWFVVENLDLMVLIKLKNEKSFIGYRDKLLESGLVEYKKGKKGSPNKYKLNSLLIFCTCKTTVQTTVQTTVYPTVETPVQTTVNPTVSYKRNENKTKYASRKQKQEQSTSYDLDAIEAMLNKPLYEQEAI